MPVRGFTADPSSGVPEEMRGGFLGVAQKVCMLCQMSGPCSHGWVGSECASLGPAEQPSNLVWGGGEDAHVFFQMEGGMFIRVGGQ